MWRLLSVALLGLASGALLRQKKAHAQASTDDKIPEQDLLDTLTSLNEIVVGIDKEQKAFIDLSAARETSCQTTQGNLQKSLTDGGRSLQTAQQELSVAMSEVDSIQGGVDTIKKQMEGVEDEISGLQTQLANLRTDRQAAVARDSGYTREVKAILKKAQQRISQVWSRSGHKDAQLIQQADQEPASDANEDGDSLMAMAKELSDAEAPGGDEKRTAKAGQEALAADAASVNEAAKKAREAFELEELRLMDLIKAKRQALKPLEANLADRQPELADQLRKISEANRSVAMTTRGLQRDKRVLDKSKAKCAVLSKAKTFEAEKRPQVRVQLVMAVSFLKTIAQAAGIELTPGAQGPVSFLQLESKDNDDLSEAVRSALRNIESLDNYGETAAKEVKDAAPVDDSAPAAETLVQVGTSGTAATNQAADSLKNVKQMIANLISSLREEQNQDQERQKFCAEQQQKAKESFKKLKSAQEDVEQSKRWAENAVLDLQAHVKFMEVEVDRLQQAKTSGKAELDAEVARITEEAKNHESSKDVIAKSREVLAAHCGLKDNDSGNCAEANAALRRAGAGIDELDEYLAKYIIEFKNVTQSQKADVESTLTVQEGNLFQAKADLNRRKDEMAQLAADVVTAKENALLASKAEGALATDCGPKVSSKEAAIARRKEEIEQLRNAVKVLDGEAFV